MAAGLLRFQRVGKSEGRRRETVEIEIALAPVGVGENFKVAGEVDEDLPT